MLKFGLVHNEANEGLLSSEEVHHCLGPVGPRGVEVMVGGVGSMASLWQPAGLHRSSNTLELMGMEMLRAQVSST